MVACDEDALICDFAEFYHVLDYRELGLKRAATLACGLDDRSRIMRSMTGYPKPLGTLLQAAALDRLSLLVWANTKDAQRGRNRPKPVLDALLESGKEKEPEIRSFATIEEFEAARQRILGVDNGSGN